MAKHYGIPYQGSKGRLALALHAHLPAGSRFVDLFGGGFAMSHAAFYDWAASRPYPVWFSSYRIEDPRFEMVWARRTRGLQGGAAGAVYNYECLYRNGAAS